MIRTLLAGIAVALPLLQAGCANMQGEEQTLVDRATLTVQEIMTQTVSEDPRDMLQRSKAVMICPRVFKAGFILGGEGGNCVLLARAGNGTWSYPAFYGLGSGSVGFQAGIQDSQLMLMILTQKGLNAVLDSQFKLGANASIAIATVGGSVGGATTAAVGADIVAFAESRGLFGGVSLEGSILSSRSDWDQAYYRQPIGPRQIVVQMQGVNQGADPLREVLTRYGSAPGPARNSPPPAGANSQAPGYQTPGYQTPGYQAPGYQTPGSQGAGYAPAYPPYQAPAGAAPRQASVPQATPPGYLPAYPPSYQPGGSSPSDGRGPIQQQNLAVPSR
jgi:SH3 domain-containing YSC84-like protein 1